jgi:heme exporter protein D
LLRDLWGKFFNVFEFCFFVYKVAQLDTGIDTVLACVSLFTIIPVLQMRTIFKNVTHTEDIFLVATVM